MRKNILIAIAVLTSAMITPAWAAGRGGGFGRQAAMQSGMTTTQSGRLSGMGLAAQQAALTARQNGTSVGIAVRDAARINSQGATYANANAITHVQNSTKASSNSGLSSGGTTPTVTGTTTSTTGTSAALTSPNTTAATGTGTTTSTGTGTTAGTTGTSQRTIARANSQGPMHASPTAISHVQNSPGQANLNSVLGNGGTTGTATTTTGTTTGTGTTSSTGTRMTTSTGTGTTNEQYRHADDHGDGNRHVGTTASEYDD